MAYRVQFPPQSQPATPPTAGSPIPEKPVTLVTGGNRAAAEPFPALNARTVGEVLGDRPSPEALQALTAEVAAALVRLRQEVETGQLCGTPLLVRARPLADWLPLEHVARLLSQSVPRRPEWTP